MSRDLEHAFASLIAEPVADTKITSHVTKSSVRYEVVSTIRKQVFWRNGIGLTATEAPTPSGVGSVEGFFVTVEYEFHGGINIDLREFVDELNMPDNSPVRKEILQKLQNLNTHRSFIGAHTRNFKYTVGITREQLDHAGGVVYLRDLDLVVGYEEFREQALHPYSQPALREQMRNQVDFNEVGNHHRLIWIDNTHQHDSMWYNNGFGVFEIKPMASPHLEDGFYLHTQTGKNTKEEVKFTSVDEAIKTYLLYATKADAQVHGKPDKAFNATITQMEHDLSIKKAELNEQKLTMDREKQRLLIEREKHEQAVKDAEAMRKRDQEEVEQLMRKQKEDWERQRDLLKMERERQDWERSAYSERMKFEYDMHGRDRKDQSENTKHILDMAKLALSLLSVGLSIYAMAQKSKKD